MIRLPIFLAAAAILALGFFGLQQLEKQAAIGFLQGALVLGGGLLICGFFSIKMLWHGVIGAGVLALLGAGRGLFNLGHVASYISGDRVDGNRPILEFAVMLICIFVLLRIGGALRAERMRLILEEDNDQEKPR